MNRFNSLQKIIDVYPWNTTEHIHAIFEENTGFFAVKLDGNFSYPLFLIKGIIPYGINFFRIVLLNCKPSF
jgi:hypothetical protein